MSDGGSDLSIEDIRRRRHSLPTEEFRVAGNPNPLGIPFYRNLPVMGLEQEERASLLGSQQYVYQSSGSDTYSGDFFDEVSHVRLCRPSALPGKRDGPFPVLQFLPAIPSCYPGMPLVLLVGETCESLCYI